MIEQLRNRRGTACLAESQHLHFKFAAIVFYLQQVTRVDLSSRFDSLPISFNSAQFARPGGQCAGLEEARSPEPFIYSDTSHTLISYNPVVGGGVAGGGWVVWRMVSLAGLAS